MVPPLRLLAAALTLAFTSSAHAAPGDLDVLDVAVVGDVVRATAVQPDGKTILAGRFTSVFGVPRSHIARLNADGTLDLGFDPEANNDVYSVAVQADGKVLLGGGFTTLQPNGAVSATARQNIARVNADGTLDTDFDPKANSFVFSVAVQADGKVLLGGGFTTLQPNGAVSATARQNIARVNADGTLDTGFDPKANNYVCSVAVQADGKVLLGGEFATLQPNGAVSATARGGIARVNGDGTLDTDFDPKANNVVYSVAMQADGKVLLGGNFTTLQPNGAGAATERLFIARVNADGTLDTSFDPKADGVVNSVAVQANGKVLLGGFFTTFQPNGAGAATERLFIARVNADGTLDTGFNPKADNAVFSVAVQADGKVLLGGYFTTLQPNGAGAATPRNFFARLVNDPATQTLTAPDTMQALWQRGGSAPELSRVTFEVSTDGGTIWNPLGAGTRIGTTANWQLTGLSLPASGHLRARGATTAGYFNGSSGLIEQVVAYAFSAPTVTTPTSANVTLTNATLGGDVRSDGGAAITERGFVFSPTASNANPLLGVAGVGQATAAGTTTGVFGLTVGGLNPHTEYTFRAYATNSIGTGYTAAATFTTANTLPAAPDGSATATTGDATTITLLFPSTDADGDTVVLTGTTPDAHLSVNSTSGKDVTFTPAANYVGPATLGYVVSDGFGGTASGTITVAITDNDAPVIAAHADVSMLATDVGGIVVNYAAATATDNVTASQTITYSKDSGTLFPLGTTAVTVNAKDAANNQATPVIFDVTVRLAAPVSTKFLAAGEPVPDRDTLGIPGGPQGDATLASFGVPCVDEAGNISYLAKWTSAADGKSAGLFHNSTCLLGLGGDAQPVPDAAVKTLGDPVGSADHVALLGTISGVPKSRAAVVFSNASGGRTPLVIAQAGTVAPSFDGSLPVGGATFKSFKAVAIAGDAVAIFAQLTGGTGVEKATAANDYGLWLMDSTHTLRLMLREGLAIGGQPVGTRTIKTLVAFKAGAGSPGQGRGWLVQTGANGPRVLALATLTGTDKAQAVLGVGFGGGIGLLTQSGGVGTGPDITGATFASYGLPASNGGNSAFLASLAITPDGPATKANARGIFIDYGNPTYTTIVRVGDPAPTTGTTFSVLKDVVLDADANIAFPATLKATPTVKGLATTALWSKRLFGPIELLAQGGARPPGQPVPGLPAEAQWKAFTSLAIAGGGRGPIFAATLVPGKGLVTKASASGVWACDFTGAPRLLFQTGVPDAIMAGKTLKSFTLLNATVGSAGVTRSFNDDAQVVWLATFTDKSQAIITTEVP